MQSRYAKSLIQCAERLVSSDMCQELSEALGYNEDYDWGPAAKKGTQTFLNTSVIMKT